MVSFLSSNSENCNNRITVIGIAVDDKNIAVVLTDDKGGYFLDGLDQWDEVYLGKKVKVTGKLVIKTHEKQSTPERSVQERVGTMKILKKPKWSLVE